MPRGDGTGPVGPGTGCLGTGGLSRRVAGLGVGGGQARFGEPVPCAATLERRAAQLESQASEYRAMAAKAKNLGKKEE